MKDKMNTLPAAKVLLGLFCLALLSAPVASAAEAPQITITGAEDDLADNILHHLNLTDASCTENPFDLLPQIKSASIDAANALGYYQPNIVTTVVPVEVPVEVTTEEIAKEPPAEAAENCWELSIAVEPGAPIIINNIVVNLVNLENELEQQSIFDEILLAPLLQKGNQLNHGTYESLKANLSALAIENGYFSARFIKSEIQLDLILNTANIEIQFDPGERFTFGQVTIHSDNSLSDEFISRMIPFENGNDYASDDLILLRQNLDQSRYFTQVSLNPQLTNTDNLAVPIDLTLVTRPQHAYSSGIGFTTDTGPRFRLGYENRYLNQNGHRLTSDAAFSPILSQVNLNYTIPLQNPVRESFNISAGYLQEDNNDLNSKLFKIEAAYLTESENGWLRDFSISHVQDDYKVGLDENSSALTIFGVSLSKIEADDLINPTAGWKLFLETKAAADAVFSDTSFVQIYGSAKRIIKFGERGRFIPRLEVGSTWIDGAGELPVSMRFFAGGDQSIRGYEYQDLGPTDINDVVIGGRHLIVGSLAYDYLIKPDWRATVFYDGGNAFSDSDKFEWKNSLGFGIHWISPIGPIRVDIAKSLQDSAGVRLHITMGPDL